MTLTSLSLGCLFVNWGFHSTPPSQRVAMMCCEVVSITQGWHRADLQAHWFPSPPSGRAAGSQGAGACKGPEARGRGGALGQAEWPLASLPPTSLGLQDMLPKDASASPERLPQGPCSPQGTISLLTLISPPRLQNERMAPCQGLQQVPEEEGSPRRWEAPPGSRVGVLPS